VNPPVFVDFVMVMRAEEIEMLGVGLAAVDPLLAVMGFGPDHPGVIQSQVTGLPRFGGDRHPIRQRPADLNPPPGTP
jgi:hypothetical protein